MNHQPAFINCRSTCRSQWTHNQLKMNGTCNVLYWNARQGYRKTTSIHGLVQIEANLFRLGIQRNMHASTLVLRLTLSAFYLQYVKYAKSLSELLERQKGRFVSVYFVKSTLASVIQPNIRTIYSITPETRLAIDELQKFVEQETMVCKFSRWHLYFGDLGLSKLGYFDRRMLRLTRG